MLKLLICIALAANIFVIVSSTGKHGDCGGDHHGASKPQKVDSCGGNHHSNPIPHKEPHDDCKDNHHTKPVPIPCKEQHDDCDDNHHDKPKPHKEPHGDCKDNHHTKPIPIKKPHDDCKDNHHTKPVPIPCKEQHDDCDDNHHDKPKPHKEPHGDCKDNHHTKPVPIPCKEPQDDCDDNHHGKPKPTKKPHDDCDGNHHGKPKPTKKPDNDCTDECPGDNEYYDECPPSCPPQTCDSIGKIFHCPIETAVCKPACRCIKDYYRDSEGKCVAEKDCDCNNQCEENETYVECPAFTCQPKTCDELGFPQPCPVQIANATCPVKPACLCVTGYLRNKKGVCVPVIECPSCGGDPNAQAGCGTNCGRHCSDYKNKEPAICSKICKSNSCDCKPDFVYDDNTKKCVAPKDCTPTCGENEVFSNCSNGGCFRTCSEKGITPERCVKLDPTSCVKGCICIDGYLRNDDDGICIPEDKCPNSTCIECTEPNEEWDPCPPICPPQTCESIGKSYSCPAQIDGKPNCQGACRCKPGYYRNAAQQCICEEDCEKCTGDNEYYDTCPPSCPPQTCDSIGKIYHCPIEPAVCKPACRCLKDYYRDSEGNCVPEKECDCNKCKANETYVECPDYLCEPKTCDDLGFEQNCIDQTDNSTCPGKPACLCVSGMVRNKKGVCIPSIQCPSCGGDPNAQPGCGVNCGRRCSTYKIKNPICPLYCKVNGCDCKPNFVYDDNIEKCVCPEDCTPICGDNEVFSNCTNGGCFGARNCSQKGIPVRCVKLDPADCIKGCICQDGYLWDDNGVCVPEDKCPCIECKGANEEYDPCPPTCPPQTCESLSQNYNCPLESTDNCDCKGACRCKSGFYRNALNECITKENCLKCSGPNEYFSCGGACDNVCATLSKQNQTHCPIVNIKCNEMCYCKEGFARAPNKTCIPIEDCSKCGCNGDPNAHPGCGINCGRHCSDYDQEGVVCEELCKEDGCDCNDGYVFDDNIGKCVCPEQCTPTCGVNEEYSTCTQSICRPQDCTQRGQSVPCPRVKEGACKKGCVCKENYLRGQNGTCVPEDDCDTCPDFETYDTCPPEKCDAEYCPTSRDSPTSCKTPKNCGKPRCVCGFNQKRDRKTGKCIAIKDCPPFKCDGPNEEYQSCPPVCPGENCSDFINNSTCPKFKIGIVLPCVPKCRCKKDFYRNENGICVCSSDCIKKPHCGPNEEYSDCDEECVCIKNYIRDKNGKCVPKDDDCEHNCGPNEEYSDCDEECVCKKNFKRDKNGKCVPKGNDCEPHCGPNEEYSDCDKKCVCKKNYVRAKNGKCVPKDDDCGCDDDDEPHCGPNEEYSDCDKKCVCKKNYVRAKNGKCVPKDDDCSCDDDDDCPKGETCNKCPPEKCDAENCPSSRNSPTSCISPKNCGKPRCVCGFNQKRDRKTGKCIAIKDCPPFKCDGPNEVFESCPPPCPGQNCSDFINNTKCPKNDKMVVPCVPQCRCKKDFYRNDKGICVCSSECVKKPICGPNEELSKCKKKCVCKPNYYRADDGTCVPEDDDDCGCDD